MKDIKKLLLLVFAVAITVSFSGCLEQPKIEVIGQKVQKLDEDNTKIEIQVLVDNPNPIGITIDKISFDIYALVDGDKIYLGHGEQSNIKITSGNSSFTLPVTISNKKLIEVAVKGKSTKIPIEIKGNISVNLFITTVNIPIDIQQEIDVSAIAKEEMLKQLNNLEGLDISQ
ncbi:Water Stress and hypersensitive response domain protein [Methanocaldococcus bathoardescens]|uniref:Water Stress and hypersensitive response domain protein n=1 Tax=Methanocaldococcus bathoardescens TaxID=1301915 RepID=A0A076LFF9_9EURY|nr:LEA type 2 family protein [Methanocaldococcus bathoardescens]AIJ05557.1 Water Stress and hypersensitive response domain protein [Methanocaldococcus bathoardescens]